MALRRWLTVALLLLTLAISATPAMAMDHGEKIWLRDTLVGTGAGLVVGLATQNTGAWVLIGLVAGGLFGYFDMQHGYVADAEWGAPGRQTPPLFVDALYVEGREQPIPVLKATLFRATW